MKKLAALLVASLLALGLSACNGDQDCKLGPGDGHDDKILQPDGGDRC